MTWNWKVAGRNLVLGDRALVMGVLNVTPDSFSDGGRFLASGDAVRHAHRLVADGADILDIGGESTRPGARPVALEEEMDRVLPVLRALAGKVDVLLSVDTRNAALARAALQAGASIVNDVSGLGHDAEMASVVAAAGAGLVLMHIRGTPETMQEDPVYRDLVGEIGAYFAHALALAARAGIDREQIVLDPGIGFGKTLEHNLALLASPDAFAGLDRPLLVGPSRKSLFGQLLGLPVEERLEATLAAVAVSVFAGAAIVRVHDVKAAVRAVAVASALRDSRRASRARQEVAR